MKIQVKKFGLLKNGEEVLKFKIKNKYLHLEILSLGGIIKKLKTPDKNGNFENIVLGYETLEEYENDNNHFSCITGRNAGRIKNGVLEINKEIYNLEKNNGNNNLHGGLNSLNKKNWKGSFTSVEENRAVLSLEYFSPHLENGFPGNVNFKVNYIIDKNTLTIEYCGESDRDTYINLTNHAYFNLSGNKKEKIYDQELELFIDGYGEVNEETLPVKYDYDKCILEKNKINRLKDIIESDNPQIKIVGNGIDHPFILSKRDIIDGILKDEKSGRVLKFKTDQPVVVVYTGNFLENKYTGICFETQDYPDVFNSIPEKINIFNKTNKYYQKTTFGFETKYI